MVISFQKGHALRAEGSQGKTFVLRSPFSQKKTLPFGDVFLLGARTDSNRHDNF